MFRLKSMMFRLENMMFKRQHQGNSRTWRWRGRDGNSVRFNRRKVRFRWGRLTPWFFVRRDSWLVISAGLVTDFRTLKKTKTLQSPWCGHETAPEAFLGRKPLRDGAEYALRQLRNRSSQRLLTSEVQEREMFRALLSLTAVQEFAEHF